MSKLEGFGCAREPVRRSREWQGSSGKAFGENAMNRLRKVRPPGIAARIIALASRHCILIAVSE